MTTDYTIIGFVPSARDRDRLLPAISKEVPVSRLHTSWPDFMADLALQDYDICLVSVDTSAHENSDLVARLRNVTGAGIIALTKSDALIDVILCLEMGADDCMSDPVNGRELAARIKAVLRRTRAMSQTPEQVRDDALRDMVFTKHFRVDQSSRAVYGPDGALIELTPLEFDLLLILLSLANQVVARSTIMARLRGPNWCAHDRAVDGLVSRLRGKLFDGSAGREVIKTVRGRGYMLRDLDISALPGKVEAAATSICQYCMRDLTP